MPRVTAKPGRTLQPATAALVWKRRFSPASHVSRLCPFKMHERHPVSAAGSLKLLDPSADSLNGPLFVRKLARLELGIDQFVVDFELEATPLRGDKFHFSDTLFVRDEKLARQTDGLGLVVSHRAVCQLNIDGFCFCHSLLQLFSS
jgi:hypothetical protein